MTAFARAHLEQDQAEAPEVSETLAGHQFSCPPRAPVSHTRDRGVFSEPWDELGRVWGRGEDEDAAHPLL